MSRYTINGVQYPSCTEILDLLDKSGPLMGWALNQAEKFIIGSMPDKNGVPFDEVCRIVKLSKTEYKNVSQKALDIGSEVHSSIEAYIKFGKDKIGKVRDEVINALLAFWDWEKANNVSWLESEMAVVNEEIGYAGTLDVIAEVNGIITCIDFKSSKAIYNEHITQVCAYKYARESMKGDYSIEGPNGSYERKYDPVEIRQVGILRLDKETGLPEWKLIDDKERIKREYKAFQALADYFYISKKRRLKNNPRVEIRT